MSVPAETLIETMEKLINSNIELSEKISCLSARIDYAINEAQNAYNKAQVFQGIGNLASNLFKSKGMQNG